MKVIILLAGHGTRLRPHTWSRPKALLKTAGNTVLGHLLNNMRDITSEEVIFVVGYHGNQIEKWVRENYPDSNSVLLHMRLFFISIKFCYSIHVQQVFMIFPAAASKLGKRLSTDSSVRSKRKQELKSILNNYIIFQKNFSTMYQLGKLFKAIDSSIFVCQEH